MARKEEMTKDEAISKEIKRLRRIFKGTTGDKAAVVTRLIDNAAFMAVSLQELQEIINEKGYTEEYQNGEKQKGVKKSSEVDIYNTMIKNFNTTMKQLIDLLPDSLAGGNSRNEALEYIQSHGGMM